MSDTSMNSMVSELTRYERAELFERECYSKTKTQAEMALEYMERFGEITPLEALSAFGCFRLGARIADLRADGYDITTEINKGEKNYGIYRLRNGEAGEDAD